MSSKGVYLDSVSIESPYREPIYSLGEWNPVGYIDGPWKVDMTLQVWDEEFISKIRDGVLDPDFWDAIMAQRLLLRPCCAYCGTPINVSDKPVKCSSCGAPLKG